MFIKKLEKFMFEIYPYIALYIIWCTGPILAAGLIQMYCNDNSCELELIAAIFIIISCIFNLMILTAIIIKNKEEENDKKMFKKTELNHKGVGRIEKVSEEDFKQIQEILHEFDGENYLGFTNDKKSNKEEQ